MRLVVSFTNYLVTPSASAVGLLGGTGRHGMKSKAMQVAAKPLVPAAMFVVYLAGCPVCMHAVSIQGWQAGA